MAQTITDAGNMRMQSSKHPQGFIRDQDASSELIAVCTKAAKSKHEEGFSNIQRADQVIKDDAMTAVEHNALPACANNSIRVSSDKPDCTCGMPNLTGNSYDDAVGKSCTKQKDDASSMCVSKESSMKAITSDLKLKNAGDFSERLNMADIECCSVIKTTPIWGHSSLLDDRASNLCTEADKRLPQLAPRGSVVNASYTGATLPCDGQEPVICKKQRCLLDHAGVAMQPGTDSGSIDDVRSVRFATAVDASKTHVIDCSTDAYRDWNDSSIGEQTDMTATSLTKKARLCGEASIATFARAEISSTSCDECEADGQLMTSDSNAKQENDSNGRQVKNGLEAIYLERHCLSKTSPIFGPANDMPLNHVDCMQNLECGIPANPVLESGDRSSSCKTVNTQSPPARTKHPPKFSSNVNMKSYSNANASLVMEPIDTLAFGEMDHRKPEKEKPELHVSTSSPRSDFKHQPAGARPPFAAKNVSAIEIESNASREDTAKLIIEMPESSAPTMTKSPRSGDDRSASAQSVIVLNVVSAIDGEATSAEMVATEKSELSFHSFKEVGTSTKALVGKFGENLVKEQKMYRPHFNTFDDTSLKTFQEKCIVNEKLNMCSDSLLYTRDTDGKQICLAELSTSDGTALKTLETKIPSSLQEKQDTNTPGELLSKDAPAKGQQPSDENQNTYLPVSAMTSAFKVKGHIEKSRLLPEPEERFSETRIANSLQKMDSRCATVRLKSKRKSTPIKCDFTSKKSRIFLTQKQLRKIPQFLKRPLPDMEIFSGSTGLDEGETNTSGDEIAGKSIETSQKQCGDDKSTSVNYSSENETRMSMESSSVVDDSMKATNNVQPSTGENRCIRMGNNDSRSISESISDDTTFPFLQTLTKASVKDDRLTSTSQHVVSYHRASADVIQDCAASRNAGHEDQDFLSSTLQRCASSTVLLEKLETKNLHKSLPVRQKMKMNRFPKVTKKAGKPPPKSRLRVTLTKKDIADEITGVKKVCGVLSANGIKVRDTMPVVICEKLKTIAGKGRNRNSSSTRVARLQIRTGDSAKLAKVKNEKRFKSLDLVPPRLPDFRHASKLGDIVATFDSTTTICCFCHLPANHLLGLGDLFGPYRPIAEEVLSRQDCINENLKGNSSGDWGVNNPAHSRDGSPLITIDKDEETCFLTARVEADNRCVDGCTLGDITRAISESSHHLRSVSTIEHILQDAGNRSWQKKQKVVQNLSDDTTVRIPGPKNECKVISRERVKSSPQKSENEVSGSKNASLLPNINSIVFLEPKINISHGDDDSLISTQNPPFTSVQRSPRCRRKPRLRRKSRTLGRSGGPITDPRSPVRETSAEALGDSTSVCISHKFNTGPLWTHGYCALWADGVYAIRSQLYGLWDAARSSMQVSCAFCCRPGATIVTSEDKTDCKTRGTSLKAYHYPCALSVGIRLNWETLTASRS